MTGTILTILISAAVIYFMVRKVTIYEYEKALKYSKGKFVKILGPGRYFIFSPLESMGS